MQAEIIRLQKLLELYAALGRFYFTDPEAIKAKQELSALKMKSYFP